MFHNYSTLKCVRIPDGMALRRYVVTSLRDATGRDGSVRVPPGACYIYGGRRTVSPISFLEHDGARLPLHSGSQPALMGMRDGTRREIRK